MSTNLDEVNAESKAVFQKLALWGQANAIKQNHGLTAAAVQRQLGGGGGVADVKQLMDLVPFGGSVNITNIGAQPSEPAINPTPTPTPPGPVVEPVRPPVQISNPGTSSPTTQPASLARQVAPYLLTALAGGAAVGIPAYLLSGNTPPAKNPAINGELELEIPFNVERKSTKRTSTGTSSSGTSTKSP
jgi:hypothetical protein